MSITIVKRPEGPKLSTTANACVISSGATVDVAATAHGLATNDIIYISCNSTEYNGFWYVTVTGANTFAIKNYPTQTPIAGNTDPSSSFFYKSLNTDKWNAVHSPIIYKLKSDLWPTNTVTASRTVSSFASDGGYTQLTLSGSIGDAEELEWVKVTSTASLDGIYQIINGNTSTIFTIDLPYNSSNTFAGGTVQKYYMNYHFRVKIFGGNLTGANPATPYDVEEVCELKVIPDSTGIGTLSISEDLKKKVGVLKNNPYSLGYLPLNRDAYTDFYIKVAESYDASSGYTLGTFVSSYTDDSANTGHAVNAKLTFKNTYGGYMADYLYATGSPGKFLTPFLNPTLFPGYFFDLSYILNGATGTTNIKLFQELYLNGVIQSTTTTLISNPSVNGVLRQTIAQIGTEDQQIVYIKATVGGTLLYGPITINIDNSCAAQAINLSWLNNLGGFDYWVFTAQKQYGTDVEATTQATKDIYQNWPNSYGSDADTIDFETGRDSRDFIVVTAQYVTVTQLQAIQNIKKSPLVQIINSVSDRTTVLVDAESWTAYEDNDKTFTITFTMRYTNLNPAQST